MASYIKLNIRAISFYFYIFITLHLHKILLTLPRVTTMTAILNMQVPYINSYIVTITLAPALKCFYYPEVDQD